MAQEIGDADEFTTVTLSGELTIYRSAEIKSLLMAALAENDAVRVVLQDVSDMDFMVLQLICSAHRSAAAEKKSLILEHGKIAVFHETVSRAGFKRRNGCAFSSGTRCLCDVHQQSSDVGS